MRYFPLITVSDTEKALIDYSDEEIEAKKKKKKISGGRHSNHSDGSTKMMRDLI